MCRSNSRHDGYDGDGDEVMEAKGTIPKFVKALNRKVIVAGIVKEKSVTAAR